MSIHTLKKVVMLVPEAAGHIKKAHLTEEFPVGTKDATISSALQISYLTKIAHQDVDMDVLEKVAKAVRLYGVSSDVKHMTDTMVKQAFSQHARVDSIEDQVREAERIIESRTQGFFAMEKVAEASEELWDEHKGHVTSDVVKLYAGAGMLNKEAAVAALTHRARQTGNPEFIKVAQVISSSDESKMDVQDNRAIAEAIVELEKKAGLFGRDIYREIFMVKEAAINDATRVVLAGKTVSVTQLKTLGSAQVGAILGKDIGDIISLPSNEMKPALEALPLAEKQALARLVR